jgi:pseudouridylate synthase
MQRPREAIDGCTGAGAARAAERGITGKAVTPVVLDRVNALTGGRSLATNIALIKHKAEVGPAVALAATW